MPAHHVTALFGNIDTMTEALIEDFNTEARGA